MSRAHQHPPLRARPPLIALALFSVGLLATLAGCGGAHRETSHPTSSSPDEDAEGERAPEDDPSGYQQEAPAAGAYPGSTSPPVSEGRADASVLDRALQSLSSDLDRALSLSVPDCSYAALLRDQICELAERVCNLADRNRHVPDLAGRCAEGRESCTRATERVRASCP